MYCFDCKKFLGEDHYIVEKVDRVGILINNNCFFTFCTECWLQKTSEYHFENSAVEIDNCKKYETLWHDSWLAAISAALGGGIITFLVWLIVNYW